VVAHEQVDCHDFLILVGSRSPITVITGYMYFSLLIWFDLLL